MVGGKQNMEARLVAKGYQEPDLKVRQSSIFSPSRHTFRRSEKMEYLPPGCQEGLLAGGWISRAYGMEAVERPSRMERDSAGVSFKLD